MIRANMVASVLALVVFAAIEQSAPAAAGGSLSFAVTPRGETAHVVRDGFRFYSWARDLRNRVRVDQRGSGNGAGVSQSGTGNWAGIFQRGRNHSATVTQNGNDNAYGIFQFGRNTSSAATQTGDGNVGFVLQGGW